MNAQQDTLIASQTAKSAQQDGRVMKGISILSILFLLGTYISVRSSHCKRNDVVTNTRQAIFSVSFFHYVPGEGEKAEQWTISSKFWIYWVIAVPTTLLTVTVWFLSQKRYSPRRDATER